MLFILLLTFFRCTVSISNFSASEVIDDNNDAIWDHAVEKGERIYRQMFTGCYPDESNPLNRESLEAIGFHIGTEQHQLWPPQFDHFSFFDDNAMQHFKWAAPREGEGAFWVTNVWRQLKFCMLFSLNP